MPQIAPTDRVFRPDGFMTLTPDLEDPQGFQPLLPDLSVREALAVPGVTYGTAPRGVSFDPASVLESIAQSVPRAEAEDVLDELVRGSQVNAVNILEDLAALDLVQTVRAVTAQVAMTTGFTSMALAQDVTRVFKGTLSQVSRSVDFQRGSLGNLLDGALANLSGLAVGVPMVGAAFETIKTVVKIAQAISARVREYRDSRAARRMLRELNFVSAIGDDLDLQKQANTLVAREMLKTLRSDARYRAFLPPGNIDLDQGAREGWHTQFAAYPARDPDGAKFQDSAGNTVEVATAWLITPSGSAAALGGEGFMPGSNSLLRGLEYRAVTGRTPPKDLGTYMPTARNVGLQLWGTCLAVGPSMFTVPTSYVREKWDAYVTGLLRYTMQHIAQGFTSKPSGRPPPESGRYMCGGWNSSGPAPILERDRSPYACYDSRIGDWTLIRPEEGAVAAELTLYWLEREFWARGPNRDQYPYPFRPPGSTDPQDVILENTVYAHALRNLYQRQLAAVEGLEALTVHPAAEDTGVDGRVRKLPFPALLDDEMRRRWERSVNQIVNDDNLVGQINARDIPQYRYKGESLREYVIERQRKLLFRIAAGPSSQFRPSSTPPPQPPSLVGGGRGDPTRPSAPSPVAPLPPRGTSVADSGGDGSSAASDLARGVAALGAGTVAAGAAIHFAPRLRYALRGR